MIHTPRSLSVIALASLLASFAAHANKGAPYVPTQTKASDANFFITAGATYLEPSFNGLDYAYLYEGTSAGFATQGETVEPGFDWGYFIQAGYRIGAHYDIQASWAQFNSSLSDSVIASELLAGNFYALPVGDAAHSSQQLDYSVFDANLGQYHNITEMLRARIFAGIRYAKIDAEINNYYSAGGVEYSIEDYDSSFSGVGPEVGMDLEYKICDTFGVVGHLSGAFLVGTQDASLDTTITSSILSYEADSIVRLVPGLDAKLGLNWNVPYSFESVGFGIEAGYQVAYYWDAVDQLDTEIAPAPEQHADHGYTNYGNMGPYMNFTAMF